MSALPAIATDMGLPALPAIGDSLSVSAAEAGLTLSVFLAGFAIAPIAYGPLADRYGRRPVLLFGSILFTLAATACALSRSLEVLLVFRVLQGIGAGAGMVLALTIVRDLFEGSVARARLSYVATVRIVAPMIAPTLGGWVLVAAGWRAIYGTMAVAGAAITLAIFLGMTETRPSNTVVARASLSSLAQTYMRVLRNPICLGNALINALTFGCQFSYISGSPLLMMHVLGMSAQSFGLVFALTAFGIMSASMINGRLNARGVSPHKLLRTGLILSSSTALLVTIMVFTGYMPLWLLIPVLMLNTFSFGMIAPNASHAAIEPVPEMAGVASGIISSIMMGTGAAAGALVTFLYDGQTGRAMGGVMLGCTLSALAIYLFWVRGRQPVTHAA
jgi:DHA1 family bicyclomycin/chloramphenicol resistance-like MFS transporter